MTHKKMILLLLIYFGTRDRTAPGKPLAPEDIPETMGQFRKLGKKTQESIPYSRLVEPDIIGHLPLI